MSLSRGFEAFSNDLFLYFFDFLGYLDDASLLNISAANVYMHNMVESYYRYRFKKEYPQGFLYLTNVDSMAEEEKIDERISLKWTDRYFSAPEYEYPELNNFTKKAFIDLKRNNIIGFAENVISLRLHADEIFNFLTSRDKDNMSLIDWAVRLNQLEFLNVIFKNLEGIIYYKYTAMSANFAVMCRQDLRKIYHFIPKNQDGSLHSETLRKCNETALRCGNLDFIKSSFNLNKIYFTEKIEINFPGILEVVFSDQVRLVAFIVKNANLSLAHKKKLILYAARMGRESTLKFFLDVLDAYFGNEEFHPIHNAVLFNHINVVKLLFEFDRGLINRADNKMLTPLMYAMYRRDKFMVNFLLQAGARWNLQSNSMYSAVDFALGFPSRIGNNSEMYRYGLAASSSVELLDTLLGELPAYDIDLICRDYMPSLEYCAGLFYFCLKNNSEEYIVANPQVLIYLYNKTDYLSQFDEKSFIGRMLNYNNLLLLCVESYMRERHYQVSLFCNNSIFGFLSEDAKASRALAKVLTGKLNPIVLADHLEALNSGKLGDIYQLCLEYDRVDFPIPEIRDRNNFLSIGSNN